MQYDLEMVKMTTSHAAMKKDLDLVEQKLHSYTKVITFEELVAEVATMTPLVEYAKVCKQLDDNIRSQARFAEKKDTYSRLDE